MSTKKIAYIELPATSKYEIKAFYGFLFGWSFQGWGGDYTAFSESGVDGGFHAGNEPYQSASYNHRNGQHPGDGGTGKADWWNHHPADLPVSRW